MITAMGEIILSIVAFALFMYIVIHDYNTRKNKESHESWLSDCKDCLHSIESEFYLKCKTLTDKYLADYSSRVYHCSHNDKYVRKFHTDMMINASKDYLSEIDELKKEYIDDMFDKAVKRMGKYRLKSIPSHLEQEYERNISKIADAFHDIDSSIRTQIWEIRDNQNY